MLGIEGMMLDLLLLAACIASFLLAKILLQVAVNRLARKNKVSDVGVAYVLRTANIILFFVTAILALGVFGVELQQLSVLLGSMFAVIGVAMFAQWSILSNITASLIIFFSFPYRVGDSVQVIDKDGEIIGVIEDISLFHVLIRNARGDLITYPNNLILQKPVIRLAAKPMVSDDVSGD